MKNGLLLFYSLCIIPLFGQYTVQQLNLKVYDENQLYNIDVDGDQVDDLAFYEGGYPIDSYIYGAVELSDSIKFSNVTTYNNNFTFPIYDSTMWIAHCYGHPGNWSSLGGSPGVMNDTRYLGYYKVISPTDSIFGYFQLIPGEGSNYQSFLDDTLFVVSHVQATTPNTPLFAGQACSAVLSATKDLPCVTGCDGNAVIDIVGGVAPFNISWSSGSTGLVSDSLCPGIETVTINDGVGCSFQDSIYIGSNVIEIDVSSGISGSGACDNILILDPSGGIPPYNYLWESGGVNDFEAGLCSGWHTYTVSDASGCSVTDSSYIPSQSTLLTGIVGNVNPLSGIGECGPLFVCNGSITVTSNGGTPPYIYADSSGVIDTSNSSVNINNLCPGKYTYWVTDANGNSDTNTINVEQYLGMEFVPFSLTPPSCSTCNDGSIHITVIGGFAPYLYTIDNWQNVQVNNGNFTGLSYGVYEFCAEDANGCIKCMTVSLDSAACGYSISSNMTCNSCHGSVYLDPVGFQLPQVSWSTGDTNPWLNDLCAGTYSFTISDSSCQVNGSITLSVPASVDLQNSYTTTVSCPGECDGQLLLNPNNSGQSPYTLALNGNFNSLSNSLFIDNLCSGNHQVMVIDANNCLDTSQLIVEAPDSMQLNLLNAVQPTCFGDCDGYYEIEIINGTGPFSANSNQGVPVISGSNHAEISNLCADSLIVEVTDNQGCIQLDSFLIQQPDSLYFTSVLISQASCTSCADGSVELYIYGGQSPYTVDWSDFNSIENGTIAYGLTGGLGNVCVYDVNGCSFCDTLYVNYIDDIGWNDTELECIVSPNPSSGLIQLSTPFSMNNVIVRDVGGKIVFQTKTSETYLTELDLSHLNPGMYLLKVTGNSYNAEMRIVLK